ncbi:MAG: TIGR00730 family Rossman fold protein [Bacteroidetes bacterium]|nr:TIGR00730 family Rossman fold protein [Bacteroidota bacterium]
MKRIAVFCGSSAGSDSIYATQANLLGQALAKRNIELVYGGAVVGLMGAVANGVLTNDGKAIGVIPVFLKEKEIAHKHLSELIQVENMHERKMKMSELCDGVIALPGGFGTLDEFFEMLTWAQLGLHQKPIAILNTGGFYDALFDLIQNMVDKGFVKPINQQMIIVSDDIDVLLEKMEQYVAPSVGKWIREAEV